MEAVAQQPVQAWRMIRDEDYPVLRETMRAILNEECFFTLPADATDESCKEYWFGGRDCEVWILEENGVFQGSYYLQKNHYELGEHVANAGYMVAPDMRGRGIGRRLAEKSVERAKERGASAGQVMAFLIASPWNSISLTIIMVALIGLGWTLLFIVLSMVIAIITGLVFEALIKKGSLPANPNTLEENVPQQPLKSTIKSAFRLSNFTPGNLASMMREGLKEARIVLRWLFFGVVLAAAIRATVPADVFSDYFGATMMGLAFTLIAATIIEVCSEGSMPIAADLLTRANAPGNSFAFLMTGVATDYTEIMVIRETMRSWKIALFLPLITVPQVVVLAMVLNQF